MGAIDTSITFVNNQVVTSTNLNNILDASFFVKDDAISGNTLNVSGGKMFVNALGITSNELGTSSVTTSKINDSAVTTVKLADGAITTSKITDGTVTTAKIADLGVATGKVADAAITSTKLSGAQAGDAPVFAARAFARIRPYGISVRTGAYKSGNYVAASGTVVTVTIVDHGLRTGDKIRLVFVKTGGGTGTVPSSTTVFDVVTVESTSVFTVSFSSTGSSGTVTAEFIRVDNANNVSSACFQSSRDDVFVVNFTTPMPNADYVTVITGERVIGSYLTTCNEYTVSNGVSLNTERNCFFTSTDNARFLNLVVFG